LAKHLGRIWWRLLALGFYTLVVAGAFWGGFNLGERQASTLASAALTAQAPPPPSASELAALKDEVTVLRQESVVLERGRQIEHETNRSLQEQLKLSQVERLALVKEISYLKRLVQEGSKGTVRVHDLRLTPEPGSDIVRYVFTVTQLIPGFGESSGQVLLRLSGTRGGKEISMGLEQLPGAEPRRLSMRFEHFQNFQGEFRLPPDFEPASVIITLDPEGEQLAETSETFPWSLSAP
jgi:hypothetical protein